MSTWSLLLRSLRFYWRTHLGVILGTALGSMVLVGALLVGDSVTETLRRQAMERVGRVETAVVGGEHFFRAKLGEEVGAVPVLLLRGSVSLADGSARANQVQVFGVPASFWNLSRYITEFDTLPLDVALLNDRLADQLGAAAKSTVIIRLEKPSSFSKDAPLSGSENQAVALRVPVAGRALPFRMGNFSLQANQVPPSSIFLPLEFLQKRLGLLGKANLLLSTSADRAALHQAIESKRTLADAELELRPLPANTPGLELRTSRVFLEAPTVAAAPAGQAALTYLVNELAAGERTTPYSMVTAIDPAASFLPGKLAPGDIVLSQWLADDLQLAVGGKITLKYYLMGERRQLTEDTREFTVKAILPMATPELNGSWMPDFPGLSDAKNCRDWEPGFAMDTSKIRDQDEAYWDKYRGTPKAFISLQAGQEMWGNRWGNLTSIRYGGAPRAEQVAASLLSQLSPESAGWNFVPLREQALAALKVPVDFGELFLSFSFFLLIAAGVLTGLLFVFSLEQRNEEAGLLLGVGWTAARVRRLLLGEGLVLAVIGSVLGAVGGLLYTWAVLRALESVWRSAVGSVAFSFSATPATVIIGILSSTVMAIFSMWLASRRQLRRQAGALLAGVEPAAKELEGGPKRSWSLGVAITCLVLALIILGFGRQGGAEAFFGAGFLLLIAGIAAALTRLRKTALKPGDLDSLASLGSRNAARRRGRSVATIAVLASGVFMVVAVDAFRQQGAANPTDRQSGTGGFALLGESTSSIYEDLGTAKGREAYGLNDLPGTRFVPMRVKEGDDASCLNLNRALQPRLLGVKGAELAELQAFHFGSQWQGAPAGAVGWNLIAQPAPAGTPVSAIADAATLEWALQKKLGDELTFLDERGHPFPVRLVAAVSGSILQGSLLINEADFVAKYPNAAGYRYFLIDAPAEKAAAVGHELSRALADYGFAATLPMQRLAELQAVENTYLAIFQALGGLGLLLGTTGLAIVVARNVLERRREFGLFEAVGFRPGQMRSLVFAEHRWLILAALGIGIFSAVVAVWPSFSQQARGFPLLEMGLLLAALLLGAFFWTWLATRLALRGEHISALRSE